MTTSAPASANACTIARPRPRLPPVTTATLPERSNSSVSVTLAIQRGDVRSATTAPAAPLTWPTMAIDPFEPGPPRSRHAAQPHREGGDVRGPDPQARRDRPPDRLPPRRRRRAASAMTTLAYCAVSRGGTGRAGRDRRARRGGARAAPSSPKRCTDRRGREHAARSRRPGRGRHRTPGARAVTGVRTAGAEVHARGDGGRSQRGSSTTSRRAARTSRTRRIRRGRAALRSRLPRQRVPEPEAQQADRPLGRLHSRTVLGWRARSRRAVRQAVDGDVAVIAKLNMADGVQGGFWLDESIAVAQDARSRRHARRASC